MGNILKGIEENRAIFAYKCVENAMADTQVAKKYKSYAKKIPRLIQNNGLGPAMAFVYSKKGKNRNADEKAYSRLYNDIQNRLRDLYLLEKDVDLTKAVCEKNSVEYREITIEVLALFNWLRRFVEGMIED